KVIGEGRQSLLAVLGPCPSHHDQVFRTSQRAEVAGDAECLAGFRVVVQARGAPVAFRDHGALQRILFSAGGAGALVGKRQPQALNEVNQEDATNKISQSHRRYPPNPAVGVPGECKLTKYRTNALTTTFPKPIGIIQRQPTFMSWS